MWAAAAAAMWVSLGERAGREGRSERAGAGAAYRIRLRVFPDPQAAAAEARLFVFLRYGLLYTLSLSHSLRTAGSGSHV